MHSSTSSQMPSASHPRSPPQTPRASSWFPFTVAVAFRDVGASAFVDLSRSVADPAGVQGTDAIVDVVADAITIGIGRAGPTADAEGIELVAVAVAVSFGDVGIRTLVDLTGPVADAAGVQGTNAVIDVIADAIGIGIGRAQVPPQTPRASSWFPSQSQSPSGDVGASAFASRHSVADAAGVQGTDAFVDVVADAISIGVGRAGPATDAEGIELVAVAVAVTFGDVGASALVDLSRSVADPAGVQGTDAFVDVVADAVCIRIGRAGPRQTPRASSWLPSQSQSPSGM